MSRKTTKKRIFPGQLGTSLFVGIIISSLGVLGWIAAFRLPETSSTLVTLLSTVSSSLLTIGVASVIYEAFQRDKFLGEVSSTVGIAESVSVSGFKFLAEPSTDLFNEFFNNSTTLRLAPMDPQTWTRQYMSNLFLAANSRDLEIHLFLPSHESAECVARLACAHSLEIDSVRKALEKLPLQVSGSWKRTITRRSSKLSISTYNRPLNNGYLNSNINSIVEISGSAINDMAVRPHLWSCVASNSSTGSWISNQLKSIEDDSGLVDMPTSDALRSNSAPDHGGHS